MRGEDTRRERGLTLIEILLILAVLGILLAIAAPNLNAYLQHLRFQEGVRTLSESVLTARDTATSQSIAVRIQAAGDQLTWHDASAGTQLGRITLPNGVTVLNTVSVNLSGRGLPPGQTVFRMASNDGSRTSDVYLLPTGAILR